MTSEATMPTTNEPAPTCSSTSQVETEEVCISVPLVRPSTEFLHVLRQAGAHGEVFTKKEVCFHLKNYISGRRLYDVTNPADVYCSGDLLGRVFKRDKFTINDVLGLIAENTFPVPDTCIKRVQRLVPRTSLAKDKTPPKTQASLIGGTNSTKPDDKDVIDSTTGNSPGVRMRERLKTRKRGRDRKRKSSTSSTSSAGVLPKRQTINVTCSDSENSAYPWYFRVKMEASNESEVLSVQDKETVLVKDSTDDLWFLEEDSISVEYESDAFSVEYEVESNASGGDQSASDDMDCDPGEGILVVCRDSDVEFWADSSAVETESDCELSDKWSCQECLEVNPAYQRYCNRCWKLRPNWLPETYISKNSSVNSSQESLKSCHQKTSEDSDRATTSKDIFISKVIHEDSGVGLTSSSAFSSLETQFMDEVDGDIPPECVQNKGATSKIESSGNLCNVVKNPESPTENPRQTFGTYPLDESKPCTATSETQGNKSAVCESKGNNSIVDIESKVDNSVDASNCEIKGVSEHVIEDGCKRDKPINKEEFKKGDNSDCIPISSCDESDSKLTAFKQKFVAWKQSENNPSPQKSESDLCGLCLSRAKTGCIIHGNSGHQVCCYQCALKLKQRGKPCPVCRRRIQRVVRNYIL